MNKETIITQALLLAILATVIVYFVASYEAPEDGAAVKELENKAEFLTEAFAMNHINEYDPDWECKKWIGIVELAKQDYPNFVEETLLMAEKKCGFDVNNITS